jgi:spoIIIJ-associated protein
MTEQKETLVESVSRETAEDDTAVTATTAEQTADGNAELVDSDQAAVDAADAGEADAVDDTGHGAAAPARKRRTDVADLEREGEVAADFLETLLDIADLDGDIDVDVDGDRAAISIVDSDEGRVPRRLVGTDGKVLEALQELTRLAVQSATGERSRLMLDVAGHRADRRAELVTIAHAAIEKAKADDEAVSLEPMSAFERKVVHDAVLEAGLVSESDGVEPRRFVVVRPA